MANVLARILVATLLGLSMACGEPEAESAHVDIAASFTEADNCPSITSSVAAPAETSTGGAIAVRATASDPDPHDTLSYAWAPAADFANPAAATTSYICRAAGRQTLILTVSDNHQPIPCTTGATLTVTCD
jgi:hypothetical protein